VDSLFAFRLAFFEDESTPPKPTDSPTTAPTLFFARFEMGPFLGAGEFFSNLRRRPVKYLRDCDYRSRQG